MTNGAGEVPALRTQSSSTFLQPDGSLRTVLSTVPVHYRADGAWKDIDESLQRKSDGSLTNLADSVAVTLPALATGLVKVASGSASVTMTPVNLSVATATVDGDTATYADVAPGVDELLTPSPGALKQTYRIKRADAAASFSSLVTVPVGYKLVPQPDRSVAIVNAAGDTVGSLPAPVAYDSSGNLDTDTNSAMSYTVTGASPVYTVTVGVDRSWLTDPARVFPVLLDPSVSFGSSQDLVCSVYSDTTINPICSTNGASNYWAYGTTSVTRHAYLKFGDLTAAGSPVPTDAVITDADLDLHFKESYGSGTDLDTDLQRPTSDWDQSITWLTQPSAFSGYYADRDDPKLPSTVGQTVTFNPVEAVQGWVRGEYPNYGVELQSHNDAVGLAYRFYGFGNSNAPTLTVTWRPQVGQRKDVQAYDHRLSDRLDLHVGYGDRNLVVNDLDESLTGPGQSLVVRHTYNSLNAANTLGGAFGTGWALNGGVDTGLIIRRGNVTLVSAGGALYTFRRNWNQSDLTQDNAFRDRNGANATLTRPTSATWRVVYKHSNVRQDFSVDTTDPNCSSTVSNEAYACTAWLNIQYNHKDGTGPQLTYATTGTGSSRRVSGITDTTGARSVSLSYTNGTATAMTENLAAGATGARSWSWSYDGNGRLSTYLDAAGNTTRYCYNTAGLLARIITPRGSAASEDCNTSITGASNLVDITYDTAVSGAVSSLTYATGSSSPITVLFAATRTLTRDLNGQTLFTDPYAKYTTYSYNYSDSVTDVADPNGGERKASYSYNGDVTAAVTPEQTANNSGTGSTAQYDPSSQNLTKLTIPSVGDISLTYGDATQPGLPDSITDPNGTKSSYTRSATGDPLTTTTGSSTDAIDVTTLHEGDTDPANGNPIHCGDASTTGSAYKGAVCTLRDADWSVPNLHRTNYSYDSMGELKKLVPPTLGNGRTTPANETFNYDGQSRPTSTTSSRGTTTSYTYNALDHVTKITYNDQSYTTFDYDPDGDLLKQADYTATGTLRNSETYTYDPLDRPATETQNGATATSTSWDGNSHLLTFTDATGGVTSYGYDNAGELTSVALPGGSGCTGVDSNNPGSTASGCVVIMHNKDGQRTVVIFPGSSGYARQTYAYDSADRITDATGSENRAGASNPLFDFAYSYDAARISKRTDQTVMNSPTTVDYAYTAQNRLSTATSKNSGGTVTSTGRYCYDDAGNLTFRRIVGNPTDCNTPSASYDGGNQQLTGPDASGTGAYDWDDNGNEKNSGTKPYGASTTRATTYTVADQADTFTVPINSVPTALPQTYLGGTTNVLLRSTVNTGSYDDLRNSALGISQVTSVRAGQATTSFTVQRFPDGQILAYRDTSTGARYYPEYDNQGSILRVLDGGGALADSYSYSAYGTQTANNVPPFPQPFGYLGAYTNPSTGLAHLAARWYDASNSRFTQHDPQTHPADVNQSSPYPYAGDDPINNSDPTGQFDIWGFVSGVVDFGEGIGAIGLGIFTGITACTLTGGLGCAIGVTAGIGLAIGGTSLAFVGGYEINSSFNE